MYLSPFDKLSVPNPSRTNLTTNYTIIFEVPIVFHPTHLSQILRICLRNHWNSVLIIFSPHSIILISRPIPIIYHLTTIIIQCSFPTHFIIFPLPVIITSILMDELPFPMSQTILLRSNVFRSIRISLLHILDLILLFLWYFSS